MIQLSITSHIVGNKVLLLGKAKVPGEGPCGITDENNAKR